MNRVEAVVINRRVWVRRLLLCSILLASAAGRPPQAPAQLPAPSRTASPALPAEHWAVMAARRAEALGLVRDYLPAQSAVPRHLVGQALLEAADHAADRAPNLEKVARGWQRRFAEEFPETAVEAIGSAVYNLGSWAGFGYVGAEGRVLPGVGVFPQDRTGAASIPNRSDALGVVSLSGGIGPNLSLLVEPIAESTEGVALQGWEVRAGWRKLGISVGRQPVGYGYGVGSGLVLSGSEPLDRLQVETLEPFRLPGFLRHIGSMSAHVFASRLEEPRHPGDPYLWGLSGSVRPHPRVTVSVHRASIMGGDSVAVPVTPRTFFRTFIGHNLLGFENEVVSGQLRVRLPTDFVLPITVYTEWAAEDAAGAWRDVPGRLYGVLLPALPGLPQVALGAEYVSFAGSCCGNPPWYRHAPHTGGWVMNERPFGHALGGEGRQVTAHAQMELADARLRLNGQFFARDRGAENLYVPGREGRSTGFEVKGAVRVLPRSDAMLTLFQESGTGWTERSAALGLRAFF